MTFIILGPLVPCNQGACDTQNGKIMESLVTDQVVIILVLIKKNVHHFYQNGY